MPQQNRRTSSFQRALQGLAHAMTLALMLACSGAWAAPDAQQASIQATVNINTADAETMASILKGVGLRRAEAIIEYRNANGEFVNIYELANVKGIGERTVERNAARIVLRD